MFVSGLVLSAMALGAAAVPFAPSNNHAHMHEARHTHAIERRQLDPSASTFPLHVINQCNDTKQFGIFQISSSFSMAQIGDTTTVPAGQSATIQAPFNEVGLRLSGNADWTNQWVPQALFEFGYTSPYSGSSDGTAYDLSIMPGSDPSVGLHVSPIPNGAGSHQCESKTCLPWNCPLDQGWTNEDQTDNGSPADTVCYAGLTAMAVVWCPSTQ